MWFLTSMAFAQVADRWELRAGGAAVAGRELVTVGEAEASIGWRPAEPLSIVVSGAVGFAEPDKGYKCVCGFSETPLDPDFLAIASVGSLVAAWTPFRGELGAGAFPFEGQLLAGPALVSTRDLEPPGFAIDDPSWLATRKQLHPAVRWGAALRFGRAVGVHVQLDRVQWIEVIDSIQTNAAGRTALSGALSWRL